MGVDVYLVRENGIRLKEIADPTGVVARLIPIDDPRFPYLRYVDLYGNTVFNRAQCEQVAAELALLERLTGESDHEEKRVLNQLRKLALECTVEPHRYLKFVGD